MCDSYKALCSDFYINVKLGLKMELPRTRETILDFFDRVRRDIPAMNQFRRYRDELALETTQGEGLSRWLAVRTSSIRAGVVNPDSTEDAYRLHRLLMELSPYYLNISPLDVNYVEVLFGFDLSATGNHDRIVYDALLADSPLAALFEIPGASPIDCQPVFGITLRDLADVEAHFEVKTRSSRGRGDGPGEPISVYLTLRRYGPVEDIRQLPDMLNRQAELGEDLLESHLLPKLVTPIRDAIASSSA